VRIFTRYVLSEIVQHALIGLGVFTFVVFTFLLFIRNVGNVLELVVRNSAPLPVVLEFVGLVLPYALTITIPMACLVGILIGISRMAADSEVTAMRASGIGAGMFVRIVGIFAIGAWLLGLANNVYATPAAAAALTRLQNKLKTTQATYDVQPRVFYEDFKNYVLYVQDVTSSGNSALWRGIFLADTSQPGSPRVTMAEQGVVVNESPTQIRLHLTNGTQHESDTKRPDQYSISTFDETDIPIQLPSAEGEKPKEPSTQELSSAELLRRGQAWRTDARARWYYIEFQRRLALPSACLVLALIGVPLGLSAHRGGKSSGFVLAIVLVFVYYFAMLAGIELARQGKLAPVPGVWLGNILFAIAGLYLLWRVEKRPIGITFRASLTDLKQWLREHRSRRPRTGEALAGRRPFLGKFPLLLDDYVMRDFLRYCAMILASLVVMLLIFTLFEILGDYMKNHIAPSIVVKYLINLAPTMIYQLTPLAVLIGVLVTFTLLTKSNEITAMKATGVSIYRVVLPVMITAAVFAIALFVFDQLYLPRSYTRQDQLHSIIKGKPPQTYLRPDRKWIFGQKSAIYYYQFFDPDRNIFYNFSAYEFDPKTYQITRRVYAARVEWSDSLQKWRFENGWVRDFNGAAIESYKPFDLTTVAEVGEPPQYFKKEVKQSQEMNYDELHAYISDLQQSGFDVVRLKVQLYKKIAYPVMTFVICLIAIPFSLVAGKRGALTGVAAAIALAMVYWVVSGAFEAMGSVAYLPPAMAAWAPDLLFALVGGYMILRVPT
jgi:lipopolysaccharide export system permease protein